MAKRRKRIKPPADSRSWLIFRIAGARTIFKPANFAEAKPETWLAAKEAEKALCKVENLLRGE